VLPPLTVWLERFLQDLPPGLVLDLGCGRGANALPVVQRGHPLVGVDLSEDALAAARERAGASNARFERADIRSWPFPSEPLAGVLLVDVLHHLRPSQAREVVARVRARLPSGAGILVVAFSLREPTRRVCIAAGAPLDDEPDAFVDARRNVWSFYAPSTLRRWFDGFDVELCEEHFLEEGEGPNRHVHAVTVLLARSTGAQASSPPPPPPLPPRRFVVPAPLQRALPSEATSTAASLLAFERTPGTAPELVTLARHARLNAVLPEPVTTDSAPLTRTSRLLLPAHVAVVTVPVDLARLLASLDKPTLDVVPAETTYVLRRTGEKLDLERADALISALASAHAATHTVTSLAAVLKRDSGWSTEAVITRLGELIDHGQVEAVDVSPT
jgi:SAM-dependent methyltransferase